MVGCVHRSTREQPSTLGMLTRSGLAPAGPVRGSRPPARCCRTVPGAGLCRSAWWGPSLRRQLAQLLQGGDIQVPRGCLAGLVDMAPAVLALQRPGFQLTDQLPYPGELGLAHGHVVFA